MKSILLFILFFGIKISFIEHVSGQSYYSEQATAKIYTDINLALQEKHLVFKLDLSDQDLTIIPREVFLFENLEYLVLDRNNIINPVFPSNKLLSLKYLSITENGIREFRISHDCLGELKELYLDLNELIEYPEINNSFIELITLSVRNNFITTLPNEDLNLSRVRFLYLDSNPLKNAENAFTYSARIERLSLFNTHLKTIPENLQLKQLTKLVVSSNPLNLKGIISDLFPNLEYLEISYVKVKSSTDLSTITSLRSLKYLVAEDMGLITLPSEINNMKKLREISLLRNSIVDLPNSFYQLKLKLINLEMNPLSEKTKSKLDSGFPKTTIRY